MFALREIQAESYEYNKQTDYFHRSKQTSFIEGISRTRKQEKLITLIKMTLQHTECRAKMMNRTSEKFTVFSELKQLYVKLKLIEVNGLITRGINV